MPTVTKSIGSSGRDYATITLWEADLDDGGIYSAGDDAVGEMYNDSVFDESVLINGGGTVGLASITVTVAEGERHDGTAGTGARIVCSSNAFGVLRTNGAINSEVSWLEITTSAATFCGRCLQLNGIVGGVTQTGHHNIMHGAFNTSGSAVYVLEGGSNNLYRNIFDNIIYNGKYTGIGTTYGVFGIRFGAGSFDAYCDNNTIHDLGIEAAGSTADVIGISNNNDTQESIRNNIITDMTTVGSGTIYAIQTPCTNNTVSNNATDEGSIAGASGVTGLVVADQYVSTVSGSEDLHLKAGSDCIDAGIDLGTTPSGVELDIDGYDRDSDGVTWDIGADEYVSLAVDVDSDGIINISSLSSLDIDAQINKSFLLTINSDKELNSEILQTINNDGVVVLSNLSSLDIDNQLNFSTTLLVVNDSVLNSLNSLELNIDYIIPIFWNGVNASPEKYWILSTRDSDWELKLRDTYWYVNISDKIWNINSR